MDGELEALEHVLGDANATPTPLSYALLRSITSDFSIEIGRGGYGVVYRGILRNGMVAVKKLHCPHDFSDKLFLDEIKCLIRAKHKNIVRFLGYCSHSHGEVMQFNGTYVMAEVRERLLCFEYVPNGSVQQYLQEKPHEGHWHERYKMIKGISQGLRYLHQERISHLDLKPENVMLDAHMEPKITDFGLSRIFGEVQSRFVTTNIRGTPGYIAPEMIDKGEISFKSDIYSLGIIVIKLLTGDEIIDFKNWHEPLDVECPGMKSCIEIAQNCIDVDTDKRPTVHEIIHKLNDIDTMIQVNHPTAFPGTELLDVYPLELSFPFEPNKQFTCTLSLINRTDGEVGFLIIPDSPERYRNTHLLNGILMPMSSSAITLEMREHEEPVVAHVTEELKVVMVVISSDNDNAIRARQLIMSASSLSLYEHTHCLVVDLLKQIQELKVEVHRATLTSIVVVPEYGAPTDKHLDNRLKMDVGRSGEFIIRSMEVHPTEPWVLVIIGTLCNDTALLNIFIWNWQTNQRMYEHKGIAWSAKFIARKQWLVVGNVCGSISVHTCPSMDQVYEIKPQEDDDELYILLAVHPTRSLLLSYSYSRDGQQQWIKSWDWNQQWLCTQSISLLDLKPPHGLELVTSADFNPRDDNTFATCHYDGTIEIWNIDYLKPITKLEAVGENTDNVHSIFAYSCDRRVITTIFGATTLLVRDFNTGNRVHTLSIGREGIDRVMSVISHQTRLVILTATVLDESSTEGHIHVWDSNTYRLNKTIHLRIPPLSIALIGSKRLIVAYENGEFEIMDIDLE